MPTAVELGVDDVLSVLTDIYQIDGKVRHDEYKILCPHPDHDDHSPSADVNLDTGEWKCLSCGKAGDLLILGVYVLGKSREEVRQILSPDTPEGVMASITRRIAVIKRQEKRTDAKRKNPNYIPPLGSYHDEPLDYMRNRRFTDDTLEKYGVRYVRTQELLRTDRQPFTVDHCIGIPVCDIRDRVVAWCYRATPASERWFQDIRYIYTPEVDLNQHWFGINHARQAHEVVITEGAIDSMWINQLLGLPTLAILGSNVRQSRKLNQLSRFRKVTIFADKDAGGAAAVSFLGQSLRQRGVPCMVVTYPSWARGGDPQELASVDVELLYHRAIPYTAWLYRTKLQSKRGTA